MSILGHKLNILEALLWLIGSITIFLADVYQYFIALSIMIMADTIIKILAVQKHHGWKAITSRKLYDIIPKMIAYCIAIIGFHAMEYFIDDTIPLAKAVCYIIATVELKSISENLEELTGTNIWSSLKQMFNRKPVVDEK